MLIATRSWSYGRDGTTTYHVNVSSVDRWTYWFGRLYHRYDMVIPLRVPGFRRFEAWLGRHGAEHCLGFPGEPEEPRWRDRLYSWGVQQDLRCYHLNEHKRKHVGEITVSEETWVATGGERRTWKGRPPKDTVTVDA